MVFRRPVGLSRSQKEFRRAMFTIREIHRNMTGVEPISLYLLTVGVAAAVGIEQEEHGSSRLRIVVVFPTHYSTVQ